jgi:hypothetical protein
MSYVDTVSRGGVNTKGVLKLLDKPEEWDLIDRGQLCERFKHKESEWYFHTGHNMAVLYTTGEQVDTGLLRYWWYCLTKKELKFTKRWLELQGDDNVAI